jgi:hypothetical protein
MPRFVLIVVLLLVGCSSHPARIASPAYDAAAIAAGAIKVADQNSDGALSGVELRSHPAFAGCDANKDNQVDSAEIVATVDRWILSKVGRTSVLCTILRGGAPVAGAEVTFTPEEFMAGAGAPGKGVTDGAGLASISVPTTGKEPSGIAPGFYTVSVSGGSLKEPKQDVLHVLISGELSNVHQIRL